MPEVLSQKQIDEMLANLQKGNESINAMEEQVSSKKVKEYDFRSPKKFTREQIKLLNSIYDNFTRLFCLQLSSMLRVSCQMEIVDVEEQQYAEFNNALSDSVLIGIVDMIKGNGTTTDDKQALVEMARPVSFTIIDRLLGGNGETVDIGRDYTDIELSLLEYVMKYVAGCMKSAWINYMDVDSEFRTIETNSRLIQSILPDETVAIIVCDIVIKNISGKINICLPAETLDYLFHMFDAKFAKVGKKSDSVADNNRKESILNSLQTSELVVCGALGHTDINVQELLSLQKGDIIVLQTPVHGSNISLEVEGIPWFKGQVGSHKKKYAVRIDETLDDNIPDFEPLK